jgi:O-antigen/teichoic acid export membrane protein
VIKKLTALKNHQGFMKYFHNTSWLFAEQLLRMIAGVFVGIWVARYLGPEQFGIFSYALAFAALFSGIAKLGLDSIVVRDLVNEPDKKDSYLGTVFWLKFIGAFITLSIVAFAALLTNNDHTTNLYIFIIVSGTIFQPFEVIDFYFQSKVLSKYVSLCKITQLLLSSALKLYVILTADDLFWFVVITLIDQATLAIALCIAYNYQKLNSFYYTFNISLAKKLLKNSWPLILSGIILMIQARIDQVMLKEFIGNTELGYYSSAMRLIEVFSFIPMILTNSLFPAIVNAKKISIVLYKNRLYNLYRLMMILFLLVAIPIYFFGNQIIIFLYKEAYAPAGPLFSLMVMRLFFTNYGVVRGAYLMTENLMHYSMITMVIGAIINIILNYLWIPDYHSTGAIWAAIASFFMTTFLIDIFYHKTKENVQLQIKSILLFKN